jgi:hypothetical protein
MDKVKEEITQVLSCFSNYFSWVDLSDLKVNLVEFHTQMEEKHCFPVESEIMLSKLDLDQACRFGI